MAFPLVDQYTGVRLDCDLAQVKPGRVHVVESPRRLHREMSYGFIHALWWVWLEDRRSVVSVPPGAGDAIGGVLQSASSSDAMRDADIGHRLRGLVNEALRRADLGSVEHVFPYLVFACSEQLARRHRDGNCLRLVDDQIPPCEGLWLPTHCFPDGIVYGVIVAGHVVSVAYAHRTGTMEGRIADLGVETAPVHRRRGYGRTCVSAVVDHIGGLGGEARYACGIDNEASAATARSVGFRLYGRSLVLAAPGRDSRG